MSTEEAVKEKEQNEGERTFTESLQRLRRAASEIGRQSTSLEDSIRLFEEGMKEAEYCSRVLEEAEQKIEIYGEDDNDAQGI